MPTPSPLRPHCAAVDRLCSWLPSQPGRNTTPAASTQDLERIMEVMSAAWTLGTQETYGAGLLVYHVYCDLSGVTEAE